MPPQIDPATGERIPEIDPVTGERKASHGVSGSWEPAPKQSFLTQPVGERIPAYREETKRLRAIAGPATSMAQVDEDIKHPIKSGVRRFLAGSEADLSDMLTPLFAGTAAVGAATELPGIAGTIARGASRAGAAGFGARGAFDVATEGSANTPEAWARRLSGLSQVAAAPAALGGLKSGQNREARMSSGAGLTQGEDALKTITPELDRTLKSQGKPEVGTIGEFQSLVKDTMGRLGGEYEAALTPIAKTRIDTQPVADAIWAKIAPDMAKTGEGRAIARELIRRAREFSNVQKRGAWTVEELDLQRERLAKSYRDVKPSDVAADQKLKARQIADRAANQAINDILYPLADQAAGKPAGYFKSLQQKQSVLFNMADDVKVQKDAVTAGSAQKKGKLLRESISPWSAAHPKTGAVREAAAAAGSRWNDPLKTASEKVSLAFKPPAPRSKAPSRALTVGAGAESIKPPAPRRHPSDEYSDPANFQ